MPTTNTASREILTPGKLFSSAAGHCALTIMTKAPRPGKVKTRLSPPLSADESAGLNKCFLRDLAISISLAGECTQGVACYTPVGEEYAYQDILPLTFKLLPQVQGDFAQRLTAAIGQLLGVGFSSVCLINSDSPTVPASTFGAAAENLASPGNDLVLGPTDDGGYYLIGMRELHRDLFKGIDWSTEKVFDQTLTRASDLGLKVKILPSAYDVDEYTEVLRLKDDLLNDNETCAPATRDFLRQWFASRSQS